MDIFGQLWKWCFDWKAFFGSNEQLDNIVNLSSTISIYGGGPGSGCTGPNCGRPFSEFSKDVKRHIELSQDLPFKRQSAQFSKRHYYKNITKSYAPQLREEWKKSEREADALKEEKLQLNQRLKNDETQHPDYGKFERDTENSRNEFGLRRDAWVSPSGDKVSLTHVTGLSKQGQSGGVYVKYTGHDGDSFEREFPVGTSGSEFIGKHFGVNR